jgi:cobalt/nickel transport system permease protein
MSDVRLPDWMHAEQEVHPDRSRQGFLTSSALKFCRLFEKISLNRKAYQTRAHAGVKLLTAVGMIILMALSHSSLFLLCAAAPFLLYLSVQDIAVLKKTMETACGAALLTMLMMLPALFLRGSSAFLTVSAKVFLSVAMLSYVSLTSPWNALTASLRRIHLPSAAVFILDLTLRYIQLLGRTAAEMLAAVQLRSVRHSQGKGNSFGGILGTLFLKAGTYARFTQEAMACRLFDGDIPAGKGQKLNRQDVFLLAVLALFAVLDVYLAAAG